MGDEYKELLAKIKLKIANEATLITPKSYSVDCDFEYGKIAGLNAALRIIDELLD